MTVDEFSDALAQARVGEAVVYFVGDLGHSAGENFNVRELRDYVRRLAERRRIFLVQRRRPDLPSAGNRRRRNFSGPANRMCRISFLQNHCENRRMPPPGRTEVVLFWITGIVVAILSGGVAVYASYHHLWG